MNTVPAARQVSLFHVLGLCNHSAPNHLTAPRRRFRTLPLSAAGFRYRAYRSGLRLSAAGSSVGPAESGSLWLRTGRSPPAASHPTSRWRSCSRLLAGECVPEEDFHLSDQARLQAHSGAASCAAQSKDGRGVTSIACRGEGRGKGRGLFFAFTFAVCLLPSAMIAQDLQTSLPAGRSPGISLILCLTGHRELSTMLPNSMIGGSRL